MRKQLAATTVALLAVALGRGTAWAQAEDDLREGDRYFEDGDWKHAASAYDNAIKKYPGQVPPEAYGKRAAIYIIQQDFAGGLTFLHEVAEKQYPNAPEVLEQEALILWEQDKKPEAIAVAEKVVKAKPSTFSNQKLIGIFYKDRDPAKTAAAFEAYLTNRPAEIEDQDVLPRIELGFAYLALARQASRDNKLHDMAGDYDNAVKQFETVEKKFGKKPHAMTNAENGLCAAYTGQGHFDRAITVCERIIQDPKKIDGNGSVWFNLAQSYLANKQPKRARTAANEYVRLRKSEARGYLLVGDSYFDERDWTNALDWYQRAEKLIKPGESKVDLSIKMGKTYRRLPTPQVDKAIAKLSEGLAANPSSLELGVELGGAYLENKDDQKAIAIADRMIGNKDFGGAPDDLRSGMLLVSAKALYNTAKVKESRARFEQAYQLRPKDVQVRRSLVQTINRQALEVVDKDAKAAEGLFNEALKVDGESPMTSLNLAVLKIEGGNCDAAAGYLDKIKNAKGYTLAYERLVARTYLCGKTPDAKKAADHYAAADAEVRKVQANLVQAEINTEWAPLTWNQNLDDAIDKLSTAVQFSQTDPTIAQAAQRNLDIALFKRGWKLLKDGKAGEAYADFDKATRNPALLKGTEPLAFEFSLALAALDKGDSAEAVKLFKELATKGNQASYLKPAYAKIGAQFFGAYANYRAGNPASRQAAANDFQTMAGTATGAFGQKVKDLAASAWEYIAVDAIRSGKGGAATKALASAAKYASGDMLKRITLDRIVASGKDDVATLEGLGGVPAEVYVDLGIAYDRLGRAKDAYDAWQKAKAKNVSNPNLQKWIDAKKRIYGF